MPSRHHLPGYRIAIVGSGAVGGYYGARLAYYGRDVHFLVRSAEERAVLKRFGWRVKSRSGDFRVAKVHAHATPREIGVCDLVIIAVKTTANAALPELLAPLVRNDTLLLTLQNGLGNTEFLAAHFGGTDRVLGGMCSVALNKMSPGIIEHLGAGAIALGEAGGYPLPRTHDIAWELKRCGIPARVVADLDQERWRKLVWNIPFNGLTVLATAAERARGSERVITTADLSGRRFTRLPCPATDGRNCRCRAKARSRDARRFCRVEL